MRRSNARARNARRSKYRQLGTLVEKFEDRQLLAGLTDSTLPIVGESESIRTVDEGDHYWVGTEKISLLRATNAWVDLGEVAGEEPIGPVQEITTEDLSGGRQLAQSNTDIADMAYMFANRDIGHVFVDATSGLRMILTGEVVIAYSGSDIDRFLAEQGYSEYEQVRGSDDMYTVTINSGTGKEAIRIAGELRAHDDVRWAEPNFRSESKLHYAPNDTLYGDQWGLNNTGQSGGTAGIDVRADEAWDSATGDGIVIAIFDSGIDLTHPDLNIWTNPGEIPDNGIDDDRNGWIDDVHGIDVTDGDPDANDPGRVVEDDNDHSTSVSGVAAAVGNNNLGVTGVAPGAQIMPIKIIGGTLAASSTDIAEAIFYAAGRTGNQLGMWRGADVGNHSYGIATNNAMSDAFEWAAENGRDGLGMVNVAASGNDASGYVEQFVAVNVPVGTQLELEWRFSKNANISQGADTAWIGQVRLPDGSIEDFAGPGLPVGWTTNGDLPWVPVQDANREFLTTGNDWVVRAGGITHGESSNLRSPVFTPNGVDPLRYMIATDSELNNDFVGLFFRQAGTPNWTEVSPNFRSSGPLNVTTPVAFPASDDETIGVGAVADWGLRSHYSQFGSQIDVGAPSNGGIAGVTTTDRQGDDGYNSAGGDFDPLVDTNYTSMFSGTSAASPVVAGAAAVLLSEDRSLTANEVRDLIKNNAQQIGPQQYVNDRNDFFGHGLLDLEAALGAHNAFTVNSTADTADANVGDGFADAEAGTVGSQVTLRAAIQEANAAGGDWTIILPKAEYQLTEDLEVTANITLIGSNDVTVNTNGRVELNNDSRAESLVPPTIIPAVGDRLFRLTGAGQLNIVDATLAGGLIEDGDPQYTSQLPTVSHPDAFENDYGKGVSGGAEWQFDNLDAGRYRVYATWVEHSNRTQAAEFTIYSGTSANGVAKGQATVNQELNPSGPVDANGIPWQSLGEVSVDRDGTVTVSLASSPDTDSVIADAIRLEQIDDRLLMDDGDFGFSSNLAPISHPDAVDDDYGKGVTSNAVWQFDNLAGGRYQIFGTWVEHSNRTQAAEYSIYAGTVDNENLKGSVTVDQELNPGGPVDSNGVPWQSLGWVTIGEGGTLSVELGASPDSDSVIADAIRLERTDDRIVIEDGDFGFNSDLANTSHPDAFDEDYGKGVFDDATWQFDQLAPGRYRVLSTWVEHSNRTQMAEYTIYAGTVADGIEKGSTTVNQEIEPATEFDAEGIPWEDLGVVTVGAGGTVSVRLAASPDTDSVIADAVRLERVDDRLLIEDGDLGYTSNLGTITHDDANENDYGKGINDGATWQFDQLAGGRYRIYSTWVEHPNRTQNAEYTIYGGAAATGVAKGMVTVDQEQNPAGPIDENDIPWQALGEVTISPGGTLTVELGASPDTDSVIADAIRLERLDERLIVEDGDFGYSSLLENTTHADAFAGDYGKGIADNATWQFDQLNAGRYEVFATWVEHGNRTQFAQYNIFAGTTTGSLKGSSTVNQELNPSGPVDENDIPWQSLGFVTVGNNGTLTIELEDSPDTGNVIADAIRLQQVDDRLLIEDGDFGYTSDLENTAHPDAYGEDYGKGISDNAIWQFDELSAGRYRVLATWVEHANRTQNASFNVYAGTVANGQLKGTAVVDQELNPSGSIDADGIPWQALGEVTIGNGGTLSVELESSPDTGNVIADAIRLERIDERIIIEDDDFGYSGSESTILHNDAFEGDYMKGQLNDLASWQFDQLAPGSYDVFATWVEHANRTTAAPFAFYDGTSVANNLLTTVFANQELEPDDDTDELGIPWEQLGTVVVTGTTFTVELNGVSNSSQDHIIGDAIWLRAN